MTGFVKYMEESGGRGPYFGWRVIFALALLGAVLIGVAISAFVMFAVPLSAEFGWSESETGALVSAMWLTGPLALVLGPAVTRLGAWRMVVFGMAVQIATLFAMPWVTTYEQMAAARVVMGIGMVAMVPAGPVIVAQWFRRRFSTAMAIVWSSSAFGQIFIGPLTVWLYEHYGWRNAAALLGVLVGLSLAVAIAVVRGGRSPESLAIDVAAIEGAAPDAGQSADRPATAAMGRPSLLHINWTAAVPMSVAALCAGLATIALQAEAPIFLDALGLTQAHAALLLSLFAATALAGVILSGWMCDRYPPIVTSLAVSLAFFAGIAALWLAVKGLSAAAATLGMGLLGYGLGGGEILWVTLFKRQFGSAVFGATYGLFYCCFQLGMAAGGPVGGLAFERWGASGFVAALAIAYAVPTLFGAWRPGRMAETHLGKPA
ncbi:MFS transporter [Blastomonas sp. UPD001]|uniref:MFS transporter n=1 Tax=Blastomonas sp. UPD001 TaxID=2217673 RepID=UPI000E357CCE|nr:MFS transporter [Blastomonas sp. UPD001]MBL0965449.1 MFS transporter [Blastomonas sp.]